MIQYKSLAKQYVLSVKEGDAAFNKAKINSSKDGYDYVKQFYEDDIEIFESFFILLLNRANNTIAWAKISQGGMHGTIVDTKIVAKYAIESLASSVIIAHNHPSGQINPSEADIKVAKKVKEGLGLFDIILLDSLILSNNSFYSFADEGII